MANILMLYKTRPTKKYQYKRTGTCTLYE